MKIWKILLGLVLTLNVHTTLGADVATADRGGLQQAIRIGERILDSAPIDGRIGDLLRLGMHWATNPPQLSQQSSNGNNEIAPTNTELGYAFNIPRIGSLLYVENFFIEIPTFRHYGVYVGNGKVIHFAALSGQEISFANAIIHETTLDRFLNGRALRIDGGIETEFPPDAIIARARSRLGDGNYCLLTNNCEHFARWVVTGDSVSHQVLNVPQTIVDTIITVENSVRAFLRYLRPD